jgi:putative tryptophan/tyrosine transport system substrate-binding protein
VNSPWPAGPPRLDENGTVTGRPVGDPVIVNAGFHRMARLSRRQFVVGAGVAGGALLAGCGRLPWQAQVPTATIYRVGILGNDPVSPGPPAFLEALSSLGYVEGRNLAVETRFGQVDPAEGAERAADLVRSGVDIILAASSTETRAAQQATSTIPVVMANSGDPVAAGFAESLARPGGNITGLSIMSPQLGPKRLELLKAVIPGVSPVAMLWYRVTPATVIEVQQTRDAAILLGVPLRDMEVRTAEDLEGAFQTARQEGIDALIVVASGFMFSQRYQIVELAGRNRLAAMYPVREFMDAAGLMFYGPNSLTNWRRAAYYVDRLLKGAKPADLPIEQPMTFEFVVNLKTAQALGITFPNEIMLQVTEVIQ